MHLDEKQAFDAMVEFLTAYEPATSSGEFGDLINDLSYGIVRGGEPVLIDQAFWSMWLKALEKVLSSTDEIKQDP